MVDDTPHCRMMATSVDTTATVSGVESRVSLVFDLPQEPGPEVRQATEALATLAHIGRTAVSRLGPSPIPCTGLLSQPPSSTPLQSMR